MATGSETKEPIELNSSLLIGGAVLVGVGAALALAGTLLGGSAVLSASRQWLRQLDQSPSEVAAIRWQQMKAAVAAGADGWKAGQPTPTATNGS